MWSAILAVSIGAALGAVLRWLVAAGINEMWPALPPGTLLVNVVGGYLIGLAMAHLAQAPDLPPEWRLFVVTGFLGGLTTFSAFSAEVITLLQAGRSGWAAATVAAHVLGSLAATVAGLASYGWWRR